MQIEQILFPVDFTDRSRSLNGEVAWLAERFGAIVTLLHVGETPGDWIRDYALPIPEGRLRRVCRKGDAATEILEWANERETDVIVMGTKGVDPLCGLMIGSVTMKVLQEADCPVWLHAGGRTFQGVDQIVCLLELAEEGVPLLRYARDAAEIFNARVRLVHMTPARTEQRFSAPHFSERLGEMAASQIVTMQQMAGTDFPVAITPGMVGLDAGELARDLNADLIVIGRGHMRETFGALRTHTFDIIGKAGCPVLSYAVARCVNTNG